MCILKRNNRNLKWDKHKFNYFFSNTLMDSAISTLEASVLSANTGPCWAATMTPMGRAALFVIQSPVTWSTQVSLSLEPCLS